MKFRRSASTCCASAGTHAPADVGAVDIVAHAWTRASEPVVYLRRRPITHVVALRSTITRATRGWMRTPLLALTALAIACGDSGSTPGDTSTGSSTDPTGTTGTSLTTATTADDASATGTTGSTGAADSTSDATTEGSSTAADSGSSSTGAEAQPVTIDFAAFIGDEPWACGTIYEDIGTPPTDVEPRDLRFFVQDLQLIRASDDVPVPVTLDLDAPWQAETVALIDFEDGTGACADSGGNPATRTFISGTVPPDDYDGISFTIGVPEDLNHGDPLFLPAPLQASSMTWGWLYGYKFIKVELQHDVVDGPLGGGLFHLGSNDCDGNPAQEDVTCNLPNRAVVELDGFDPATNAVAIDVAALFAETNMTLDTQCHSFQAECEPMFTRIGVDFDTGLPSATQAAFSVQ